MSEAGNNLMAAYSIAREGLHRRAFVRRKAEEDPEEDGASGARYAARAQEYGAYIGGYACYSQDGNGTRIFALLRYADETETAGLFNELCQP